MARLDQVYISLTFQTSLERLQLEKWVNNTNLPVILAVRPVCLLPRK